MIMTRSRIVESVYVLYLMHSVPCSIMVTRPAPDSRKAGVTRQGMSPEYRSVATRNIVESSLS